MRSANAAWMFCTLIVLFANSPASAADWQQVGYSDEAISYIDQSSIQASGRYRMAWTKWVLFKPDKSGAVEHKSREAYDCVNQKTRLVAMVSYGSGGKVIESFEWSEYENQFKSVVPDSILASAMEKVCANPNIPPAG